VALPSIWDQLARYAPDDRPRAVVQTLRQLSRRAGRDVVLLARLSHEAHDQGYWSKVPRADGTPYLSEADFFEDVLAIASWRTAMKRVALGRALAVVPPAERDQIAERLGNLGAAKATILVPALEAAERPEDMAEWVERAAGLTSDALQREVSTALGAVPRGTRRAEGDRVAAFLRSVMPDPESVEVWEEFLRVGKRAVGTESTIGVLIAAFQEALGSWSGRAAPGAE